MSTLQSDTSDTVEEPAHESSVPEPAASATALAQRLTGPLTVVNGHAQLIRRRANGQGKDEAAALERSLVAIELAVRQMLDVLMLTSTRDAKEKPRNTEELT